MRGLSGLVGKRLASRPHSAGVRRLLERALAAAGIDSQQVHRSGTEHATHRDVALAVLAGVADVGLTTQAWARKAQLTFLPLGSEAYELVIPAAHLGDARAVALCEAAQGREPGGDAGDGRQ
jgi:molybdate-binding protein